MTGSVTYDPQSGCSYIYLVPVGKGEAVKQLRAGPNVILDLNIDGQIIGIEMLTPSLLHPALRALATTPHSGAGE